MTTLKTLIASAIVAVSATAAFADSQNWSDRIEQLNTAGMAGVMVEGRNSDVAANPSLSSDSYAGIVAFQLNDRPTPGAGLQVLPDSFYGPRNR
jgi:hypothetical protein